MPIKSKYTNNLTIYEFPKTYAILKGMKESPLKSVLVEGWLLFSGYIQYRQDIEKCAYGDHILDGCGSMIRRGTPGCPSKHIAFRPWFKTHHRYERYRYIYEYRPTPTDTKKARKLLAGYPNSLTKLTGVAREAVLEAHAATSWAKAMCIPGGPWETHDQLLHSPEYWSGSDLGRQVWSPSDQHPELLGKVLDDMGDFALIQPFNGDTTMQAYDLGGFSIYASER